VAALVIAGVAARDGWQTWNGDDCRAPTGLERPEAWADVDTPSLEECGEPCCTKEATREDGINVSVNLAPFRGP